jgi:hypothetical protein
LSNGDWEQIPLKTKTNFFYIFLILVFVNHPSYSYESSSAEKRKSVSVTIYNGGLGLVREVRTVKIPKGKSTLRYEDVASSILPQTVRVKPAPATPGFTVFEQNYEYDLISEQRLLEKYVGREVTLYRTNPNSNDETMVKAKLIAYNNGPVYQIGKEISLGYPGRVVVSSIPENLFAKPTLVWELATDDESEKTMEVSYQTGGMGWSADYNLNLNDKEDSAGIQSWVTLSNSSGTSFENATLQLVAGKVQLVSNKPSREYEEESYSKVSRSYAMKDSAPPEFKEENLSEYYLYTLDQPTTVGFNQTKQVQLFAQEAIKIEKRYIFDNLPMHAGNEKKFNNATVRYDILNSKNNSLGRPLPSGTMRIFKADSKGRQQLLGEDTIDHTPNDEWVKVSTGKAFDVVANGKQMSYESFKLSNGYKASYEVELRNRKKEDITIRLYGNTYGEWKITDNSHKYEKESNSKIFFDVKVPAGKVEKVVYTIENRY